MSTQVDNDRCTLVTSERDSWEEVPGHQRVLPLQVLDTGGTQLPRSRRARQGPGQHPPPPPCNPFHPTPCPPPLEASTGLQALGRHLLEGSFPSSLCPTLALCVVWGMQGASRKNPQEPVAGTKNAF